jgi:DHA1 family bicyclomycin/chloramphenicol resistance-like MFS transporter
MSLPEPRAASADPDDQARSASGFEREALWFRLFLFGIAAVGPFSLNIFKPCLPWIMADFGASMSTVQLSLSLSILAAAVATVLSGPVADRLGRRPVLLGSLSLYLVGSAGAALAPTIGALIVGRVLQAGSSSVALVTARAVIHDVFGETESSKVIARVSLMAVLLVVLAPVLGGVLIDASGWRAVFWTSSAFGTVLVLAAWTRLEETAPRAGVAPSARATRQRIGTLLRSPVFHGYAMQSSLHFATFFAFTSAASYLMVNVLHHSATDYGLWFMFVAVFVGGGLVAAGRLAGRVPSGRLASCGSLLVLAGCALSAWQLLQEPLTAAGVFVPAALSGFGIGLALPATNAGVMAVVPELAGTGSGLMGFQQYVCAAIFAQVVVQDESHTPQLLAALSLAGGFGSVAFSLLSLRHGRTSRPA